jgi:hypothetical protein
MEKIGKAQLLIDPTARGGTMRVVACVLAGLLAGGCAEQSAMRMANDTVRINVSTAPIYGSLEPERRAMILAAQETIKDGYDKFIIVEGSTGFHSNVLGEIPGQASGMATVNMATFNATGPQTIRRNRYETAITIRMFKADDPRGANAVDAHEIMKSAPKQ